MIGREGDLRVDDNPYLHRNFLRLQHANGLWWLINDGSRLAATMSDVAGRAQSWLAPGAHVPIVFGHMCLTFSAGSTTYEVYLFSASPLPAGAGTVADVEWRSTIGRYPSHRPRNC